MSDGNDDYFMPPSAIIIAISLSIQLTFSKIIHLGRVNKNNDRNHK